MDSRDDVEQRLTHYFAAARTNIQIDIFMYDDVTQTNGHNIVNFGNASSEGHIGFRSSSSSTCYSTSIGDLPTWQASTYPRKTGWQKLSIKVTSSGVTYYINNTQIRYSSHLTSLTYITLQCGNHGYGNENCWVNFDKLKVTDLSSVFFADSFEYSDPVTLHEWAFYPFGDASSTFTTLLHPADGSRCLLMDSVDDIEQRLNHSFGQPISNIRIELLMYDDVDIQHGFSCISTGTDEQIQHVYIGLRSSLSSAYYSTEILGNWQVTNIPRNTGWQHFALNITPSGIQVFINDKLVRSTTALNSVAWIRLMSGNHGSGNENMIAYFDDVRVSYINLNRSPIANAGPDRIVECLSGSTAPATLNGSQSTDPDNDPLEYTWRENGVVLAGPTMNPISSVSLAVGMHNIELTVDDKKGCSATDQLAINVVAGRYLVLKLKSSAGAGLAGGKAKWADGSWHDIYGETDALGHLACVISNPNFSKIQMTYNQGSIEQTQAQLQVSDSTWQTELVRFELRDHFNMLIQETPGGKLDQGGGYWYSHGCTGTNGFLNVELFARSAAYKFRMTYRYNVAETQYPIVPSGGATVVFKTLDATVRLLDHAANPLPGGNVQLGNGSWFDLGTTDGNGEVHAELFSGSWKFRMNLNGTSQEKIQNISTAVVYQTGKVERDYVYTGTIKASIGGAWRTYWPTAGSAAQLLAGAYLFVYTPDPGGGTQESVEVRTGQTRLIPWGGYSIAKGLPEDMAGNDVQSPATFALQQNYPNPFNPTTHISFQLPSGQPVLLNIYNSQGQLVRTLIDETLNPGTHSVPWNGFDQAGHQVAAGLYVYILRAGEFAATRKMLYIR